MRPLFHSGAAVSEARRAVIKGVSHGVIDHHRASGGRMADIYRLIRQLLWFAVGVLLSSWVVFSHAETISASYQTVSPSSAWRLTAPSQTTTYGSCAELLSPCQAVYPTATGLMAHQSGTACQIETIDAGYCTGAFQTSCQVGYTFNSGDGLCHSNGPVCPSGGNWTLEGSNCIRPDCDDGQIRGQDGVCGCPLGKTLVGGMCVTLCPSGYHVHSPDNGTCEKDCFGDQRENTDRSCGCDAGRKSYYLGTQSQAAAFQNTGDCVNGCQQKASFFGVPFGGGWITSGTTTGAACAGVTSVSGVVKATIPPPAPPVVPTPEQPADPRTTSKNNSDPDSCASAGGIYYSTGGVGKCASPTPDNAMDKQKLTSGTKTGVQQNPDGSSIETNVQQQTVSDGQGGTKTITVKTITSKDPGGNVTGTTTTTESSGGTLGGGGGGGTGDGTRGFCQENPDSPICKKSAWSGDCDVAPSCDGDAVQCATAKAVWEHRCVNKWAEKTNDLASGVDQTKLFGDMDKATAALNNDGSKDWDVLAKFQEKRQNYLTFASSCSPDLSFDFKGQHYQFDTTILCQLGIVVKILLHLGAFMVLIRLLTVKLF